MPAVIVHYSFAKMAMDPSLSPFEDVVRLGTQGPDTFMAYGTNPFHKREDVKEVQPFGGYMHHIDVSSTYFKMMQYANQQEEKEMLYAYIEGIFMHFAVDRRMHPYIFYESGFDEQGGITGFYKWSHGAYEALLDVLYGKSHKTYINTGKAIKADLKRVEAISKMWAACAPTPLKEEDFLRSYEDFYAVEKMLFSRSGIKRILFRMMGKQSMAMIMSHPHFVKKFAPMDVLNLTHREWKDPSTLNPSKLSVDEILDSVKKEYEEVRALILKAKEGEDVLPALKKWCDNLDHDGEKIGESKKEFSLCWDKLK